MFDKNSLTKISQTVKRVRSEPVNDQRQADAYRFHTPPMRVRNTTDDKWERGYCVEIDDYDEDDGIYDGKKPTGDSLTNTAIVGYETPPGGVAQCSRGGNGAVLAQTDDTVSVDDDMGSEENSYRLKKDETGYKAYSPNYTKTLNGSSRGCCQAAFFRLKSSPMYIYEGTEYNVDEDFYENVYYDLSSEQTVNYSNPGSSSEEKNIAEFAPSNLTKGAHTLYVQIKRGIDIGVDVDGEYVWENINLSGTASIGELTVSWSELTIKDYYTRDVLATCSCAGSVTFSPVSYSGSGHSGPQSEAIYSAANAEIKFTATDTETAIVDFELSEDFTEYPAFVYIELNLNVPASATNETFVFGGTKIDPEYDGDALFRSDFDHDIICNFFVSNKARPVKSYDIAALTATVEAGEDFYYPSPILVSGLKPYSYYVIIYKNLLQNIPEISAVGSPTTKDIGSVNIYDEVTEIERRSVRSSGDGTTKPAATASLSSGVGRKSGLVIQNANGSGELTIDSLASVAYVVSPSDTIVDDSVDIDFSIENISVYSSY